MELVSTVEASDRWVVHCTWVPWKGSDSETALLDIVMQICFDIKLPSSSRITI